MSGPRTVEEAMRLPEIAPMLDGGYFLGGAGIDGESICVFVDKDGKSKAVECIRYTKDGPDQWVKTPLWL